MLVGKPVVCLSCYVWGVKGQTVKDEFAGVVESGQVVNPYGKEKFGTVAAASREVFVCRVAQMNLWLSLLPHGHETGNEGESAVDVGSAVNLKSAKCGVGVSGGHKSLLSHNGPLKQGSHVGDCVEHAGGGVRVTQFLLFLHLPQLLILPCLFLFAASLKIFPSDSLGQFLDQFLVQQSLLYLVQHYYWHY